MDLGGLADGAMSSTSGGIFVVCRGQLTTLFNTSSTLSGWLSHTVGSLHNLSSFDRLQPPG